MSLIQKMFSPKKDPITSALEGLSSSDEQVVARSKQTVRSLGPSTIPSLITLLENRQPELEWLAISKMIDGMERQARSVVRDIISKLNSNNSASNKEGKNMLGKLPDQLQTAIKQMAQAESASDRTRKQRRNVIPLIREFYPAYPDPQALIVALVRALGDEQGVSDAAFKILSEIGTPAQSVLLQVFQQSDSGLRRKAARILFSGESASPELYSLIRKSLTDSDDEIRKNAVTALGRMGSKAQAAIPDLIKLLETGKLASEIQNALECIDTPDAIQTAKYLDHSKPEIRLACAKVLGKMKAGKALPFLYEAMIHADDKTRNELCQVIITIGPDEAGVAPLCKALVLAERESPTRQSICKALAGIGAPAIPALLELMEDKENPHKIHAMRALGYMVPAAISACPALIQAASDPDVGVRTAAIETLGRLGPAVESAIPVIVQALSDPNSIIRNAAISALGNMGSAARAALPVLLESTSAVSNSVELLGKIGDPQAIDPLLKLLFNVPRNRVPENIKKALTNLVPGSALTNDLVSWAVRASTFEHKFRGWSHDAGYISFEDSDSAIQSLCAIKNPITSNILHLISQKADVSVTMDTGCSTPYEEKVSFEKQRSKASAELKARGDPPSDPEAYFKAAQEDAGKLAAEASKEAANERERHYRQLLARAKAPRKDLGEDKWTIYQQLAEQFKTVEVFRMIANDFGSYHTIGGGDMSKFSGMLVKIGKELSDYEAVSGLSAIQAPWPNAYSEILERIRKK